MRKTVIWKLLQKHYKTGKKVEWFRYDSLSTHKEYAITERTDFLLNMFLDRGRFYYQLEKYVRFCA